VETATSHTFQDPATTTKDTFDSANLSVNIVQPILRNFGADVTLAEVFLTRNARASDVQALRQAMLDAVAATEQAYWEVFLARQQLLIQLRLLERTVADREILLRRRDLDVPVVSITEASSFVEQRRFDVIQARQRVRVASDALKRLINDPDLPLSGEAILLPADVPADLPIEFSLLDAVTTALQQRPEMQRALLAISDASIRLKVADNQRLPELNLSATARINGIGDSTGEAYSEAFQGDFIDYLFGAQFEVPIGNRGPEAQYRRFQLERQSSVVDYRRVGQLVVLEVKDAMRQLSSSYELIGAARSARRAAADNLRAIQAQEEAGVALTPEFIDLKLRRQEALAGFEVEETQALATYNTAIAQFYRSTGTLLRRNGIVFTDSPVEDLP
jgi:outer membrane protein TolC